VLIIFPAITNSLELIENFESHWRIRKLASNIEPLVFNSYRFVGVPDGIGVISKSKKILYLSQSRNFK